METFFIVFNITLIISITYMIYFINRFQKIKNYNRNKTIRIILLYILPILTTCNIIFTIIYLFSISIYYTLVYLLVCLLLLIGIACLFGNFTSIKVIGIFTIFIWLILFLSASYDLEIKYDKITHSTQNINLYSTSNFSNEGEILIQLSSLNENNNNISYTIMKYDKDKIKDMDVLIPLYIKDIEYTIINDENDRIELTKIETKTDTIFSYFEFCESKTEFSTTVKLYINPDNIKYH